MAYTAYNSASLTVLSDAHKQMQTTLTAVHLKATGVFLGCNGKKTKQKKHLK